MGKWLRKDALARQHPKMRAAGFWGTTATFAAWEQAKAFDRPHGEITRFWTLDLLADWLHVDGDDLDRLRRGMEAAERAGLIERTDDGLVLIHDWDEHQPQGDSTERVADYRKRKRGNNNVTVTCYSNEPVSPSNASVTVTTHGTDGTGQTGRDNVPRAQVQTSASEPVRTGGSAATRENAVALLQCYVAEYKRTKRKPPVVEFGGADLNAALKALTARSLAECKALIVPFLKLGGREAAEGHKFTWFPGCIAKLEGEQERPNEPRLKTPDEMAAGDPEAAERLRAIRAHYQGAK